MVWYPPVGSTTTLPLCGEWIIIQMNPAAMVKHLDHPNAPKLVQEFANLPLHTYLAVFRRYLEAPSEKKPWHMCELFVMHKIEPAKQKNETGPKDSIVPAQEAERKDRLFPPREDKQHYVFQNIYARLRTRVVPLPREAPQLVHEEIWPRMRDHLMMRSNNLPTVSIEVRNAMLERLADPEFQPASIKGVEVARYPWDAPNHPGICLLPHFDYTFDTRLEISPGHFWENEHTFVIKRLLELVPTMPRLVRIPVRTVEYTAREFYVEHKKSRDPLIHRYLDERDGGGGGSMFQPPPLTTRDRLFGVIGELGRMIIPERRVEVVTIERAYEYKVEEAADGIWVRVPDVLRTYEDEDDVDGKSTKRKEIKVNPPVRRQSIIPADRTRTVNGVGFIDEKFYVPFVDKVALDVAVIKGLEPDEGERYRRSRFNRLATGY